MSARTKLCRAFDCPRYIEDLELFCPVHFGQLLGQPRILAKISDNREPPGNADRVASRRILTGFQEARDYLAKREGRAADLAQAKKKNQPVPGQGGAGGASYPTTGSDEWATDRLFRE